MQTVITNKNGFSKLCNRLDGIIKKAIRERINTNVLQDGSVLCTAYIGNKPYKMKYYGYTIRQSQAKFANYIFNNS